MQQHGRRRQPEQAEPGLKGGEALAATHLLCVRCALCSQGSNQSGTRPWSWKGKYTCVAYDWSTCDGGMVCGVL